jgi:hypothetical protein
LFFSYHLSRSGKTFEKITKLKYLFALKLLLENPLNLISPDVLHDSLAILADPLALALA